jgi:flagellar biosynthetic protein FlhB
MATDSTAEDRTEEPTARRLQRAREDGEAARSMEMPAASVVIAAAIFFVFGGAGMVSELKNVFAAGFVFDHKTLETPWLIPGALAEQVMQGFITVMPLLLVTIVAAVIASGVTGGYLFSMKAVGPNFEKLDPLAGLKKMFGGKAAVELLKTLSKFSVVCGAVIWVLNEKVGALTLLGVVSLEPALGAVGTILARATLVMALSLLLIAAFDALYQRSLFARRMRMTKEEIRDELKEMEGRPEVKAHIRRRQREISSARMIDRIKDADVVITNPEHFAVALAYDPSGDGAPLLIAKGLDDVAFRMIEEAKKCGVYTFPAPPLARALYYTTKTGQTIPEALFYATAQVIAYVFNLNSFEPGVAQPQPPVVEVPDDMRFDSHGVVQKPEGEAA